MTIALLSGQGTRKLNRITVAGYIKYSVKRLLRPPSSAPQGRRLWVLHNVIASLPRQWKPLPPVAILEVIHFFWMFPFEKRMFYLPAIVPRYR